MDKSIIINGLWGVVTGDMVGLQTEFKAREAILKEITDIGDSWLGEAGTWSDDSSMTLCIAESLSERKTCNINDIAKRFIDWYLEGYLSVTKNKDVGMTIAEAITNMLNGESPYHSGLTGEHDNGNGSLMRMLPVVFYTHSMELKDALRISDEVSAITHAHLRTLMACGFYLFIGRHLINGKTKEEAYKMAIDDFNSIYDNNERTHFKRILSGNINELKEDDVHTSGYCIHSLESSLWLLLNYDSHEEVVLKAANLADDADTVGAIAGGLSGIYYGNIPEKWMKKTINKRLVNRIINGFAMFMTGQ